MVAEDDAWQVDPVPIRDPRLRADAASVMERANGALGRDAGPLEVDDVHAVAARVGAAAGELLASLRTGASGDRAGGVRRDVVVDLLVDLRAIGGRLDEAREAGRTIAFGRVRDAMALLRGVTTVDEMLERGPLAAARLGFDRTIVSSIRDSCFVPRTCFMAGDTEWAEALVRAGGERPRRLDRNLLETEMVRRRQPIRVLDAQNDPRVHPELAEVSMSRSYVAAPVVVRDRVIGFIHGDHFERRRAVGPVDLDVLWMFADAFGFAFERIAYGERIDRLRATFLETMSDAEETFARACEDDLSFDEQVDALAAGSGRTPGTSRLAPSGTPGGGALDRVLTRRELEVLRLMADGATNDGIASRLVISHGTAKTHVKHILRKLGAANRAEAVSRWFQLERGGAVPRP